MQDYIIIMHINEFIFTSQQNLNIRQEQKFSLERESLYQGRFTFPPLTFDCISWLRFSLH